MKKKETHSWLRKIYKVNALRYIYSERVDICVTKLAGFRTFLFLVFLLLGGVAKTFGQTTGDYRSNATTVAWGSSTGWQIYSSGAWGTALNAPSATTFTNNTITVQSGHTLTIDGTTPVTLFTASGTGSGNTILVTGSLLVTGSGSNVVSLVTLSAGNNIKVDGSMTLSNSGNGSASASFTCNGTIKFTNTSSSQFTWGTSTGGGTNTFTVAGKLITANANGIYGTNASIPTAISKTQFTANTTADYEFDGAAQTMTGIPSSVNNLTLSGSGIKTFSAVTVNGILSMEGSATVSGSPSGFGANATLQYKGSVAQTTGTEFPATWSGTGGVKINNASGVTLTAAKNLGTTPLIIGDVIANSIFNDGGFQLTSTGTLTLNSGTFKLGSGATATTYPSFSSSSIASGTTVDYGSSAAQTISAVNYANLTNSGNGARTLASSGTIGISGSLTTGSGTFTVTGSTLNFNGTSAQTIPALTCNNLTLSNTAGATLSGNVTVNGTLSFTSGIIATTLSNTMILGSAANVVGAGVGKYVYGTLRRFVPATANLANFAYPIGDASNYAPVSLTFTGTPGGTGSIDASTAATAGAPDPGSNISQTQYVKRSWKLTNNSVTGFSSYAPTFTFVAGDIIGGANTSLFITRLLSSATWYATTTGTRTSTTTSASGVTLFGDFYIGEQAAATKLAITGTSTQTAGGFQNITITALDNNNSTATAYSGSKTLIFSGANASLSPATQPTITDVNGTAIAFGSPVTVTFVAGVAQVSGTTNGVMKLYKAEVANISVSDGNISATGTNRLTVTVSAASANKLSFSTQPGSGVSNTNLSPQPQVSILDVYGNLVSNATNAVTLAISNNAGPGATLSVTTNPLNAVGGIASFSGVKLDKTGIGYTLLASATSLTSTTSSSFNISSGPATKLVITGLSTQSAGATQSITITAKDASGNTTSSYNGDKELIFSGANASPGPVVSYPTIADKSGTAKAFGSATIVTFVNGVATVSLKLYKAETASITATDGTISADADRLSVTVSSSTGTQLTFTTQPGNGVSLAALSPQPVVKILDAYGNVATGATNAITLAIGNNPNSGTLSATSNPLNASSGVASFSSVNINKAGTGYTLTASASGLTGATSSSFNITAAAASRIQLNAGNAQTAPVLSPVKTLPSVLVTDASGNPVSGVTVTFTVTAGGGSVTGATATSNANGIATVGSWTLGPNVGTNNNTLQASSVGLTGSPVSFTATAVQQIICPSFNKRNNGEGSGECYPGDQVGVNIPSGKQKSGVFTFNDGAANYGVSQVLLNGSLYQEGSTLYQGSIFFGGFNATTKQICFYGNSQSDNATPAGNWKFNFTDAYGNSKYCDYVVTSTGSASDLQPGSIAADQTICAGATPAPLTSSLDASVSSSTIAYQWQKSTTSATTGYTNISGATSNTYAPGSLSATTYFMRIATDKTGLSVSSNVVTITVNPSPSKPVVSVTQPSCSVSTGTITVVPSGNAGDTYSYDGVNYSNTSGVFSSLNPGTYSVTVKNSYGCVSAATSVTVNAVPPKPSQPVISSSASGSVCEGTGVTLTSTAISTGKYQWYKGGVAIVGATGRTYTTYQSGSYTVTTTDGCTSDPSAASVVTITPLPTASITQSTQLSLGGDCSQTTLTLVANSDAVSPTYQWKKDGSNILGAVNATYAASSAGTYTVAITNNGCTTVSPASVIASFPTASAAGQTTICQGESVTIQANTTGLTNPTFQWQVSADGVNNFTNASGSSTNASYQATSTGYYRVSVSYDGITQTSCAVQVTVNALPTVSVSPSATNLCSGSTATLTATAGGGQVLTAINGRSTEHRLPMLRTTLIQQDFLPPTVYR